MVETKTLNTLNEKSTIAELKEAVAKEFTIQYEWVALSRQDGMQLGPPAYYDNVPLSMVEVEDGSILLLLVCDRGIPCQQCVDAELEVARKREAALSAELADAKAAVAKWKAETFTYMNAFRHTHHKPPNDSGSDQSKLAADLKESAKRETLLAIEYESLKVKQAQTAIENQALTKNLDAAVQRAEQASKELDERTKQLETITAQLKASDSLAAASKLRISQLEGRLFEISVKPLRTEIQNRPANEWSAEAVLYWVEHVFGAEHKTAQISGFVKELKARESTTVESSGSGSGSGSGGDSGAITGSVLLSLNQIKQFKALGLTHLESIEMIETSIESLRQRSMPVPVSGNGGAGCAGGDSSVIVFPP